MPIFNFFSAYKISTFAFRKHNPMQEKNLRTICFSATGTTLKCLETVAEAIGLPACSPSNIADRTAFLSSDYDNNDIVLAAAPVYGGRIPSIFADKLRTLHGNGAIAIAMVIYGNRDYDDALLELTDILSERGFKVMAAGAFIAQHSIFPKAGMSRPDRKDIDRLVEFGESCRRSIERTDIPKLPIKGNRPYKKYGGVPIHPTGDQKQCRKCGICVKLCPTDAIEHGAPWLTDTSRCISCGRCIVSCPSDIRQYRGVKYVLTDKVFTAAFSKRKEPEFFV